MKRFFVGFLLLLTSSLGAQSALDNFRQGQLSFQRDDYWSAVDAYRQALQMNPRYMEAYQGLSEAFFALGEYDEAEVQIQQALKLGRLNTTVDNLYGRILLGQMKLEEALAQFQDVLTREPKNQGALFGLAEYQVMKGRLEQASSLFEDLRRDDPANLRAELSLLYLSAARGDRRAFEAVYSEALKYHSSDPRVHLAAARFWYSLKDKAGARVELDNFLKLSDGKDLQGWLFQAQLLLDEKKPALAIQTIDEKVIKGPMQFHGAKLPEAWFLRGLAQADQGQLTEATNAFRMALNFAPEDETILLAYENLLLRRSPAEDPLRVAASQLHLDRAKTLLTKNFQSLALDELRRGLQLNPFSIPGRLARAGVWKSQGLRTSALEELETLAVQQPTYKAVQFQDDLEILRSLYDDSLSAQWGLKLSDLDALNSADTSRVYRPYRVAVYFNPDDTTGTRYRAAQAFAETFADEWGSNRSLDLTPASDTEKAFSVDSFNSAFQNARDGDLEYFVMLTFHEGLRDFSADAKLYLARTGKLIQSFAVYKKGTLPVTLGIRELAKASGQSFPLRGSLIARKGTQAFVNLGKRDGVAVITPNQKFQVLRDGSTELTGDKSWFAYNDADLLGTWTVTGVDDWTAEGKLDKNGFFDTMAVGDEVVLVPDPPKVPAFTLLPVSATLQRDILSLR